MKLFARIDKRHSLARPGPEYKTFPHRLARSHLLDAVKDVHLRRNLIALMPGGRDPAL